MNRRDLIKTAGLAFAGSALFPFDGLAKTASEAVVCREQLKLLLHDIPFFFNSMSRHTHLTSFSRPHSEIF